MNPIADFTQKLERAFGTSGLPERNRYILMLRAVEEFMRDLDLPSEWRRRTFELGLALGELEDGITPELLKPAKRTDGGRPSDEWRVWIVRGCAVLALESRLRTGMPPKDAVKELKKLFPRLDDSPFTRKGQLETSIRNWQRKMAEVKRNDHLSLVAEQHEDARDKLSDLDAKDAISVADMLLRGALR